MRFYELHAYLLCNSRFGTFAENKHFLFERSNNFHRLDKLQFNLIAISQIKQFFSNKSIFLYFQFRAQLNLLPLKKDHFGF